MRLNKQHPITVATLSNRAGFVDGNRILMPSLCSSEAISADEVPGLSCELNKLLRINTSESLKKKHNKKTCSGSVALMCSSSAALMRSGLYKCCLQSSVVALVFPL